MPYYHDGSVKTLEEAIQKMARYQVGREISDDDCQKVKLYLNALTGQYKGKLLTNRNSR